VVCDHITRATVACAPKDGFKHMHAGGRDSEVAFFLSVCARGSRGVVEEMQKRGVEVFADWSFMCGCAGLWM
jgi:hypothetical protein